MLAKYKAVTIYHYHDGPLIFSFHPIDLDIFHIQIARVLDIYEQLNYFIREYEAYGPAGPYVITEDEVDWSSAEF